MTFNRSLPVVVPCWCRPVSILAFPQKVQKDSGGGNDLSIVTHLLGGAVGYAKHDLIQKYPNTMVPALEQTRSLSIVMLVQTRLPSDSHIQGMELLGNQLWDVKRYSVSGKELGTC